MAISSIEAAIEDFRNGKFVIIVDDPGRENEGDLTIAAQFATPEAINFMAKEGRGLICTPLLPDRLAELQINMMVPPDANSSGFGTPFTVSVEAKKGVSTGISAFDRSTTIQTLINPATQPTDIARPGHVFPLSANPNGVLAREGQTEASVDMAKLSGLYPGAVICEIMNEDGTMARMPELEVFGEKHDIKIITIEDLKTYRLRTEKLVEPAAELNLPTHAGTFVTRAYEDNNVTEPHLAMMYGELPTPAHLNGHAKPPLVRLHSECLTGDALGSLRCDCGPQLREAQRRVAEEGYGAIIYLRQEGRGIGLLNKLKAYELQDQGLDTVEANHKLGFTDDQRDYGIAAQILRDIGIDTVRLLTNNPAKVEGLEKYGIRVVERVPLIIETNDHNAFYMQTKKDRMRHIL